jgi:predicted DNA-binding transcriptional regulator AlpA
MRQDLFEPALAVQTTVNRDAAMPLLVGSKEAARLCGISVASWHRLNAAGKVPPPSRLGGRVLWSTELLRLFVAWGCPNRAEFSARLAALKK